MKSDTNIVFDNSYYTIELIDNKNAAFFNQFTNWLSAEFDLFLQESLKNEFIIYYPNGSICINYNNTSHTLSISVKNKTKTECIKVSDKVLNTYSFLKSFD